MRKLTIIAVLCILVIASSIVAFSQVQGSLDNSNRMQNTVIGIEDSKNKVKEFIEQPDVAVYYRSKVNLPRGDVLELYTKNGKFYVNAQTGDVELAYFNGSIENSNEVLVSMDKAEKIAKSYAEKKYRTFAQKDLQLTRSKLVDHGDAGKEYVFEWSEKVNSVSTLNKVQISVNPTTGDVITYMGVDRPLNVSIEPVVTKEDAIKIASAQFQDIKVQKSQAELAVTCIEGNAQKLVWSVNVDGGEKDQIVQGGNVIVDAVTGEVLLVWAYQ